MSYITRFIALVLAIGATACADLDSAVQGFIAANEAQEVQLDADEIAEVEDVVAIAIDEFTDPALAEHDPDRPPTGHIRGDDDSAQAHDEAPGADMGEERNEDDSPRPSDVMRGPSESAAPDFAEDEIESEFEPPAPSEADFEQPEPTESERPLPQAEDFDEREGESADEPIEETPEPLDEEAPIEDAFAELDPESEDQSEDQALESEDHQDSFIDEEDQAAEDEESGCSMSD
jgi:hypothetical protein